MVISLTPEAQHRAVEMTRGAAVEIEYWPTLDPTLATGSREAVLDAYRGVRDALRARILRAVRQAIDLRRLNGVILYGLNTARAPGLGRRGPSYCGSPVREAVWRKKNCWSFRAR